MIARVLKAKNEFEWRSGEGQCTAWKHATAQGGTTLSVRSKSERGRNRIHRTADKRNAISHYRPGARLRGYPDHFAVRARARKTGQAWPRRHEQLFQILNERRKLVSFS